MPGSSILHGRVELVAEQATVREKVSDPQATKTVPFDPAAMYACPVRRVMPGVGLINKPSCLLHWRTLTTEKCVSRLRFCLCCGQ